MTNEVRAGRRGMLGALVLFTSRVACALAVLAGVANPTAVRADPAVIGEWDAPRRWPAVAVHLILLPSGKVLFYRGDEKTPTAYVWDPATEQIEQPAYPGDNIFCSAHAYLPDGRVLVIGGDTGDTGLRNQTLIFDPWTSQWSRAPSMRWGRYYPTSVSLGDGRVLVFSGKDENGDIVELVEVYVVGGGPGGSDRWDLLPNSTRKMNYYPRMQLLPSGNIFHLGESPITEVFDPATEIWSIVANTNYTKRYQGTVVALPPSHERFMIMGGGNKGGAPTETAEIIDLTEPAPTWRYTDPMHYPRGDLNAVVLPDGKILVVGGTDDGSPIYPTEMFDPATETWTLMAPMATKRGYHSTAVLLPDGRVLGAGANGNRTREIYSPPYLFRGARPLIDSAPSSVEYGESFSVETPDALRIATVVFIRLGSATHAANMEQRYVPLTFVPSDADTLEVEAPTGSNVAPPGYYMLFILDADGIPSTAPFIHLRGSGTAPPTTSTTTSSSTTTTSEPIPTTTTTLPPGCGNGVVDVAGEECDGAADAACPGFCLPDCRCAIRVQGTIEADATVDENNPNTNFGSSTDLWADANEVRTSFLRARVAGVGAGTILQALLRLRTGPASNAASDSGGRVHAVYACGWDEAALTFDTRPAIDGVLLGTGGAVGSNTSVDFDVTDALAGDGAYCFALDSLSENGVSYLSREASSGRPELWITYRPAPGGATTTTDPGPTTTSMPTTTTTTEPLPTTTSIPTTTTTLPPGCGNGVVDAGEDCDGAADAACPGLCLPDCRCAIRMQGTLEADATIDAAAPGTNFGASPDLWADADVAKTSLLRARVAGVGAGTIVQAVLRLRTGSKSNAESESGGRLHSFSACGWNETAVTWATRPAIDGLLLGTLGDVKVNTSVDFDVTAALAGDGAYCFALDSLSENGVTYVSREGSSGPELWITYRPAAGGATTSTTNAAPTTTSILPTTTTTAAAPTTTSIPTTTTTTEPPPTTTSIPTTTTTLPPGCGNGVVDAGEDCDGAADAACPGLCLSDCRCAIRMQGTLEADATIDAAAPNTNFGTSTNLWADANEVRTSFLRARVAGVGAGTIVQALLRLRTGSASNAESESGGRLHTLSACSWNEATLTFNTRPAIDGMLLGTLGDVKVNTTVEFDVTDALGGDGAYCFALDSLSENGVSYLSREASSGVPELWITYRPAAGGATTSTTTTTNATPTTTTTLPPPATVSVEARVVAGSDDAEEESSRSVKLTSPDLDLTTDGSTMTVGIRFAGVDIPLGASITRAYIQFTADEVQSGATSLVIQGEATDDAPTFTTAAGNVSSRTPTGAAVAWPSVPAWTTVRESGPNQRTPDISGVIQEIVNQGGWARGNALAVIVTGTGLRTAMAFEGGSTFAPLLHVEYGASPP